MSSQRSMEVGRGALFYCSMLVLVLPGYNLNCMPASTLPAYHAMFLAFCRWGNALSTKMFVGKDFVLKHIRVKHAEKVDEYKNKVGHPFCYEFAWSDESYLSVNMPWLVPKYSLMCCSIILASAAFGPKSYFIIKQYAV